MADRARIIKASDLSQMRADARMISDAKTKADTLLDTAREKAKALHAETVETAKAEALAQARSIVEHAEATAKAELSAIEAEVSGLVAETVTRVIGDMDQTVAIKAATKSALQALTAQTTAKIRAAPDVFRAVSEAVADGQTAGAAKSIPVTQDEGLIGDRVILSSNRGHTEIGLSAQIAAATEPWRGDG